MVTQGRLAAPVNGADAVVEGRGDEEQVTVVDRAPLELGGELSQEVHPGELPGLWG
jgi:hypothetical protein